MPSVDSRIVVKLTADLAVALPYQDDLISVFPDELRHSWEAMLPGTTLDRTLPTVDPDAVRNKLALNEEASGSGSENLLAFFALVAPPGADPEALAASARTLPFIEAAYIEQPLLPAGINFTDDPLVVAQGYLGPKPVGINALHAWAKSGGDGAGVKFVDVENGFLLNHEDLVDASGAVRITTLPTGVGSSSIDALDHSTAVLGVMLATDNDRGIVGIAPNVKAFAAPISPNAPVGLDSALIAIWLDPAFGIGTVVLLEFQDFLGGPVETDLLVRSTIRELTRSEITVVVPAGNSGHDLNLIDNGHGRMFDRTSPFFFDSGAIMVAGANPGTNDRYVGTVHGPSCHGNRIDCFAWGDGIVTASAKAVVPGGLSGYTDGVTSSSGLFGGTSGAAAIVAGAAVSLQGMHQSGIGSFLRSSEVRTLLSDLTLNTPPAAFDAGRLGAMPDLERLAQQIGIP